MRTTIAVLCILTVACWASAAAAGPLLPYEAPDWSTLPNPVDAKVFANLQTLGAPAPRPCSDEVFIRRASLDVIGTLPTAKDVYDFVQSTEPGKRAALIESLLAREEFADYWAMRWCDLLRVKSEFPINLWPNAVQAYHHWIRDSIRQNKPYDQFVRELLTASGSNFRVPPSNFYRAVTSRDPSGLAAAVALTFLGQRFDRWPQARREGFAAFFSRVTYKSTQEWKEEIVLTDPAATGAVKAVFPDDKPVVIAAGQDPRVVLADWLLAPGNSFFARCLCNRVWFWLLGRGIIHEVDDIRPDNPAADPALLALLQKEFVAGRCDLKQLFRLILNSRVYQQSSVPGDKPPTDKTLYACYNVRRLDAEVLIDALCWIGGDGESYSSAIPEPYTFIPKEQRTIALADGSITSQFLEVFGRPARDTGQQSERTNAPTEGQRSYLLSSADVQRRIQASPRLNRLVAEAKGNLDTVVDWTYLTVLSRHPTAEEAAAAKAYVSKLSVAQGIVDLAWALINTKEFSYRH